MVNELIAFAHGIPLLPAKCNILLIDVNRSVATVRSRPRPSIEVRIFDRNISFHFKNLGGKMAEIRKFKNKPSY